jgi:HEAT repeat protein
MMLRSASLPVSDLVRQLVSSDRDKVEKARTRLTLLGTRAVPALISALEGGNDKLKLQAIPALSVIRDRAGREPIIAMLRDAEPKIREAACRALGRFPSRESIACLEKVVKTELRAEVRAAAVQSLATIFDEGFQDALREPLGVLFDAEESIRVRLAALTVLPGLHARQRKILLAKLRDDPDREIAACAATLEQADAQTEPDDEDSASRLTTELASSNHARWSAAMHRLIALGSRSLPFLVTAMRARHKDPEFASRAAMVLKGLGPRRLRPVVEYLDSVVEPLPLEVLVDVVASLEDRPLIYRLRDVIDSLETRRVAVNGSAGPDPYARVRARAHLAIARLGSRVAIADLKETLRNPSRRIDPDLLAAAAKIGTRNELPDLLRAWRREEPWMRAKIRDVFWQIVQREKIRHRGTPLKDLSRLDREALRQILAERRSQKPVAPTLPGLRPRRAGARGPRAGPSHH